MELAVSEAGKRTYRQGVRAAAAAETGRRILDAFQARLQGAWFDEITLEQVARDAGVTVPTVVRRFEGKEGLLKAMWRRLAEEIPARRVPAPGEIARAVRLLGEDYEITGDLVLRALAQEDRFPTIRAMTDHGRAHHRAWVAATFAPWLDTLGEGERGRRLDALVAATDLYVWKLVRRDMGRSREHLQRLVLEMVGGIVGESFDPAGLEEGDDDQEISAGDVGGRRLGAAGAGGGGEAGSARPPRPDHERPLQSAGGGGDGG
jgi:AcrR family transcriptional regulator